MEIRDCEAPLWGWRLPKSMMASEVFVDAGCESAYTDGEVLFVAMSPDDGTYEPLLGYIILEQSQAAGDMLGYRLIHVMRMDLKQIPVKTLDDKTPLLVYRSGK